MAIVYIIYSEKLDKFYIGATTLPITERLAHHNDLYYENKFSSKGIPWSLFWSFEVRDMKIAIQIETHIKNMKSKKYIHNLAKYPEIALKLIEKYDS